MPVSVAAFWDGGTTYRARVALPDLGVWTYTVAVSDPANVLDGMTGEVMVAAYTGADPFRARGWLAVSADRRFLTYADGTPFFWLADTAWEVAWASTGTQVTEYVTDRRSKGFNVVHIVANSHQYFHPYHIKNYGNTRDPYLINNDHTMLNPAYFARLDAIIEEANDAGMAVALVPIWGTYGEPHRNDPDNGHQDSYSLDDARTHARYVGARYAGHNVIWIVGGDRDYFTDAKRAYWDAYARELRDASGGRHRMTVHSGGYSGSYNSWPVPPDWLDFHMYQAGHYADARYTLDGQGRRVEDRFRALNADGGYHWEGALTGYTQPVYIPVLNAESNYEDIIGRFWDFAGTNGGERVLAVHVRNSAYWGLLSGSTVGYSYGANGVWSWVNAVEPNGGGGFRDRYTALEAIALPGSAQMGRMRAYAEARRWYEWVPAPARVRELDTDHFVAAAVWRDALVIYAPQGSRSFEARLPADGPTPAAAQTVEVVWTNPVTGQERRQSSVAADGRVVLAAPDGEDWLAVVSRQRPPAGGGSPATPGLTLRIEGRNPARRAPTLVVAGEASENAWLDVTDLLGRRVHTSAVQLSTVGERVVLPDLAPGVYVGRLTGAAPGRRATIRFTVIR